jgi:hypothetical protein
MNPGSNDLSQSVDPVVEAYKRDIDWSLVRENLKKTPEERVLALMELIRLADEAQRAGRARDVDTIPQLGLQGPAKPKPPINTARSRE